MSNLRKYAGLSISVLSIPWWLVALDPHSSITIAFIPALLMSLPAVWFLLKKVLHLSAISWLWETQPRRYPPPIPYEYIDRQYQLNAAINYWAGRYRQKDGNDILREMQMIDEMMDELDERIG